MGGKEIPGYSGEIGAYIARFFLGEVPNRQGNLWKGKNKDFRVN